ncbi:MAG TPA: hypothetical protein PK345_07545 [Bacteroidales bacterium]|jgi:hypothetical protein|nr:hypothetical protein [Bacteroidales bacterium]NLH33876.1 hypothetical protein [Lentimicrobium sp.]OQC38622.1 MAG: hypothetical protein BWX63_00004 [Bacteroidetes bacterium ADurb.Bin041]MBP7875064.1 hypothetical protein [Bacteroidales bacterium]MCZ2282257.1 hypothetical protein [Bacteroidales bacterium]
MNTIRILGIYAGEKVSDKAALQKVLTNYGNIIRTRLGLNQEEGKYGIIILELAGDEQEMLYFENALLKIEGLEIQKMQFIDS